jgi:hypothetical protein
MEVPGDERKAQEEKYTKDPRQDFSQTPSFT